MAVLRPSPPLSPAVERYRSGQDAALRFLLRRASPGVRDDGGKLYVAVGRSPEKTLSLLRWTFRRFGCREIGLLHVHRPSPLIPTLLGKIPVSQANEELVSAYRRIEREETKKILLSYLRFCHEEQVYARVVVIETDQLWNGIADIVSQYSIRKLVMGSSTENCFKLKGSFSKTFFSAKNVPPFCEIWFVSKGRHIWTREASELADSIVPTCHPEKIWSSPQSCNGELLLVSELTMHNILSADLQGIKSLEQNGYRNTAVIPIADSNLTCSMKFDLPEPCDNYTASSFDTEQPKDIDSKDELEEDDLYCQLEEVTMEIEKSKREAFLELSKRKKLEYEVAEAISTVETYEAAHENEIQIREELEGLLKTIKQDREEVLSQRDEALRELQYSMKTIDILYARANEMALLTEEAAGELELIESSIDIFKTRRPENNRREERPLINHGNGCIEFTKADLQTATCDFSESFKLGQGGYGRLYKGEIRNKTVMIKQLHGRNVQGEVEFQQEVDVLGKMRHPHLLTLIGMCPQALSLVYEYMPNGTLQDCLCSKNTTPPMTWRIRARIAAEISSALLFLHSSEPEKIVHGDLKPENIFLDDNYTSKLGNFGRCQFAQQDEHNNPFISRHLELYSASFSYDPEYQMTKELMAKSDVYSFGIIILQLLTGKPARGLESEVRRALLSGNLVSILDPGAGDWPLIVARRLAEVGLRCLNPNAQDPPELTPELVNDLEQLHVTEERPVPSFFLCPILQEIMQDPQVAADGFTYEGRALREWFSSGQDTSPMTNLKLKHQNLMPNHALRFAIEDWLCQS
ncbi:U-box domain-containing protein 33-like [Curcuma longa]|uniref:U-box domain-containing protein 33-like n=1 Tax=Curcuma longa TaxID=136217 RepID=UPI003D9F4D0F